MVFSTHSGGGYGYMLVSWTSIVVKMKSSEVLRVKRADAKESIAFLIGLGVERLNQSSTKSEREGPRRQEIDIFPFSESQER